MALFLAVVCAHLSASAAALKNVLFIAVDDLRPQLGCYNASFMATPRVDALAAESLTLARAFTNYPYCSPSRNSFMSGRAPDVTRVFNFLDHFRETGVGAGWTALPEYFKQHGYFTVGSGKLYHPGLPPHDDNPRSWSVNLTDYGGNGGCVCAAAPTAAQPHAPMSCRLPDAPGSAADGGGCADVQVAQTVMALLRQWNATRRGGDSGGVGVGGVGGVGSAPFFAALGLHKPHLPWAAPGRFFDRYEPVAALPTAAHPLPPVGMPPVAYHHCQWQPFNSSSGGGNTTCGLTEGGGPATCWPAPRTAPVTRAMAQRARHGYYAAVSFTDALIGEVLDVLDELGAEVVANTVVLLTSDHGWQLGEHGEYCKTTLFDLALHIPMLIRDPSRPASRGATSFGFAENLDIYRTLADLAGLPPPPEGAPDAVGGSSLAPLLDDPTNAAGGARDAAFSQQAHCFRDPHTNATIDVWTVADSCTVTPRDRLDVMGYSVRVECWRMTRWLNWLGAEERADWAGAPNATELYAHCGGDESQSQFDRYENENLAADPAHAAVLRALDKRLRERFEPRQRAPPPPP